MKRFFKTTPTFTVRTSDQFTKEQALKDVPQMASSYTKYVQSKHVQSKHVQSNIECDSGGYGCEHEGNLILRGWLSLSKNEKQ